MPFTDAKIANRQSFDSIGQLLNSQERMRDGGNYDSVWLPGAPPTSHCRRDATLTVTLTDAGVDGDFAKTEDNATVTRSFTVTVTPIRPTISSPGSTAADRHQEGTQTGNDSVEILIGRSIQRACNRKAANPTVRQVLV